RDVYIHGLIRDPLGQKMSKSKGNVIDPLGLLDTYGTDALRFALAAFVGMGRDIKLAPERIEGYRNFANKLWNAARFVLMNVEGGTAGAATADALARGERSPDAPLPERWILSRLERVTAEVREALEAYRFNDAAASLYQFTWREFCDWYVEAAKLPLAAGGAAAARGRVAAHRAARACRAAHLRRHPGAAARRRDRDARRRRALRAAHRPRRRRRRRAAPARARAREGGGGARRHGGEAPESAVHREGSGGRRRR